MKNHQDGRYKCRDRRESGRYIAHGGEGFEKAGRTSKKAQIGINGLELML